MKMMKYITVLLLCAGIANAAIIYPSVSDSGSFDATGDAGSFLVDLTNGDGLIGSPLDDGINANGVTHVGGNITSINGLWTTVSAGTATDDFFAIVTNETVQLDFALGGPRDIKTAYIWGYYYWSAGNSATSIEVSYATDGTGTTFGNEEIISLASPFNGENPAQVIGLPNAPAGTTHVRFLFLDNGFGTAPSGGDRVALGEVLFGETAPVNVAPSITSFTASNTNVLFTETVTLSWEAAGTDATLTITPDVGDVTASGLIGSVDVDVSSNTTYTLSVSNSLGVATEDVVITGTQGPPVITSFTASPDTVTNGGTTTLAWTTTNADTLTLDPGSIDVSGLASTQLVVTAETIYTLTATGAGGTTNEIVTVTIQEPLTGTIIQPASITGNIEGDAGSSIADLTSGSGLSTTLVNGTEVSTAQITTHVLTGTGHEDSWTKPTSDGVPVFSMDLGSEQSLDAAILWQYGNNGGPDQWDAGNHTRQFELIFHTAAEGPIFDFDTEVAEFSGTMAYIDEGSDDSTASNIAQIFQFPVETAQYVGLRIVSNWGGEQVDGNVIGGGDRFGLGEIRFATGTSFVADPIGNIMITGPVAVTGGQGMVLTWDSSNLQSYDVQAKSNLITQATWETVTNVTGTGSSLSVTTEVENAETFYQVVTPTP